MIIREVEKPKLSGLWLGSDQDKFETFDITEAQILNNIKIIGSGKGAIAVILQYLTQKGIITSKLDEVLVPDWLGYWVYNQIQPYAFPAKRLSERTKVILVYHQYGFPQDMVKIMALAQAKNLIVIEDCAHALYSYYQGKRLGTIGDFAVFSFSKWFFCLALGGARAKFSDFSQFVDQLVKKIPRGLALIKDAVKFISEKSTFSSSLTFRRWANSLIKMSYPIYGEALRPGGMACRLLRKKVAAEVAVRQKRYQNFYQDTSHLGICHHLEKEGITPYVIPIIVPVVKKNGLLKALKNFGFETGVYYFDVNRNLLEPKFVETIWIPCHGGMSEKQFAAITKLVINQLS